MDKENAINELADLVDFLKGNNGKESTNGHRTNPYLNMLELRDMDFNYDWLVEGFWPMGAHLHIFALPKTGKSLLMLWIACSIATGKDPFSGLTIERKRVSYIDNEMTLKDLHDRISDMGFDFEELQDWLLYHPYPIIRPMDTEMGGLDTVAMMQQDESSILIIDTLSRVVQGEENSNDTYRNFYNHTGRPLKANNVSLIRLDHAGHDATKSRGASAKADDVDCVYAMERKVTNDGNVLYVMKRTHTRVGFIKESIELLMTDDPIVIKSTDMRAWSLAAINKAKEMDKLDIPINVSQREAIKLLKAADIGAGKTTTLSEAIRLRQYKANSI